MCAGSFVHFPVSPLWSDDCERLVCSSLVFNLLYFLVCVALLIGNLQLLFGAVDFLLKPSLWISGDLFLSFVFLFQ